MGKFIDCAACRVCEGAAYQAVPSLYAGYFSAPVLVIAQNPGEIKPNDKLRLLTADQLKRETEAFVSDVAFWSWYMWDFGTSYGCKTLERIFGKDWLTSGTYVYTNAVRCRTKGNATPSLEMKATCRFWTTEMIKDRKAIVLIGKLAAEQLLAGDASSISFGEIKKHKWYGHVLYIPHYSAWKHGDDVRFRNLVKKLLERAGIGGAA